MNVNDLHWLAGLLEGEGHFAPYRNTVEGEVYLYPKIQLRMNDEDVVRRVATLFGGSACHRYLHYRNPQYKPFWQTAIVGSRARKLMVLLQPLMGLRRQQRIAEVLCCCVPKTPRKLTQQTANEIRMQKQKRSKITNLELAQIFGVSPQMICNVLKNRNWITT